MDPEIKLIPIGESELLRDGEDLLILALGTLVHPALEAAQELAAHGVSAAVVNARFVRPLDEARFLPLIERCGAVLTVEEHAGAGGFGGAVLEMLAARSLTVPARCLAIGDELVEHGETLASQGLEPADMVRAGLELLGDRAVAGSGD